MKEVIQIVQSLSAFILIIFVLLQVRGTGFGRNMNSASFTRRGVEKMVFKLTFAVVTIFLITSVALLFI